MARSQGKRNTKARNDRRRQQADRLRQRIERTKFTGPRNAHRREVAAVGVLLHERLRNQSRVAMTELVHEASLVLQTQRHPLDGDKGVALQKAKDIVEGLLQRLADEGMVTIDEDGMIALTEAGEAS